MPSPNKLELVRGRSRDFLLQVLDPDGDVYAPVTNPTPFLLSDTLAATVWAGDDTAAVVAPAAAWTDVTAATYTVTFDDADTTLVAPGDYRLQVTAARGGRTAPIGDCGLRVTAAPGTAVVPLAFTAFDDLLEFAPWVAGLQAESDLAGFGEQQARATSHFLDALVALAPQGRSAATLADQCFGGNNPGGYLRQQLEPLAPLAALPVATLPDRVSTAASWFDARVSTALYLRPRVKEICAKWALESICQAQVGRDSKTDWWALATFFGRDADSLFRSCVFEIDLSVPQTGRATLLIDGGSAVAR